EGVQAIIPGQSQKLQPRLTRFGEPVERLLDPLNVFRPSPVVSDPVAQALEEAGIDLRPAQGPKDLALPRGLRAPLLPNERFDAGQTTGRVIYQMLERIVSQP